MGLLYFFRQINNLAMSEEVQIVLPERFKKVDYLIANGSQYIDTNYVPTNETGYYLEGQGYTTSETYYFGCNETSNWGDNKRIYFCATPNINWGWMTYGTLTNAAANLRQETKVSHNFLNSRISKATINEKDFTYNLPKLNFTPTRNIYLFGINLANSSVSSCLKGRIDTFLISEGDQIVRQFVPCLDEDGIPCMYELYTRTVYYNQGSGQFSYPRMYTNDPINLPAGYTKCAYLQSDGTQWIDTEVVPDNNTGVYVKTQHLSYGDFIEFGAQEGVAFYPLRFDTKTKMGGWAFGSTWQNAFSYNKADDLIYTSTMNLYNDRTVNFWSDDTNWSGLISTNFKGTITRSLWLFSYNTNDTSIDTTYGKFGGRIFRAKITQDDYLIRDFVPCLDADNRPCMYDLITQEAYYNQSGGVEFAYCVEHQLPSDFIKLKYLEDNGTQFIDTKIVPNNETGLYVDAQQNTHTNTHVMGSGLDSNSTGFGVPRFLKGTANTCGFMWKTWKQYGYIGNGTRFEGCLNLYNDRKATLKTAGTTERINTLEELGFTPTASLHMFRTNYASHGNWNGRIYRAKITQGTELIRDFVPAYDSRRNKPCMYDLINNVAYYNDGTGEFIYNKDFEGTYKGFSGLGCIGNKLSGNAYRLVNALITDGKCRINLGKGIVDSTISHDFRGYTTNSNRFMFGTSSSGHDYFWQGDGLLIWGGRVCSVDSNSIITVIVDAENNKVRYNDTIKTKNANFVSDKQTCIFDVGRGDNETWYKPAAQGSKFYKWVMKKDGVTIHDYRPAVDNNLIPCVLDTITGEAFYNALSGVLSWE